MLRHAVRFHLLLGALQGFYSCAVYLSGSTDVTSFPNPNFDFSLLFELCFGWSSKLNQMSGDVLKPAALWVFAFARIPYLIVPYPSFQLELLYHIII